MSKKNTVRQAARAYEKALIENGYSIDVLARDGNEYHAITASFEFVRVKRIGNSGGHWADLETGMVVDPVWFR